MTKRAGSRVSSFTIVVDRPIKKDSNSIATSKRLRHYHQQNGGEEANLKVVMAG